MAKLPHTIYKAEVNEALERGTHEIPLGLMIKAFKENGYGEEKARKWIDEMVKTFDHTLSRGVIKLI